MVWFFDSVIWRELVESFKGSFQKLLSGFFPLRGRGRGGTPQFAKKTAIFGQKTLILALFDPFF